MGALLFFIILQLTAYCLSVPLPALLQLFPSGCLAQSACERIGFSHMG